MKLQIASEHEIACVHPSVQPPAKQALSVLNNALRACAYVGGQADFEYFRFVFVFSCK